MAGSNSGKSLDGGPSIRIPVQGNPKGGSLRKQRRRVEARLATLDTDGDGVIDREELVDFLEDTISRETRYTYLKWAAGLLLVFTVLMLGAIVGLTWGIVSALKDTKSTGGALADKSSDSTLRSASAGYMGVNVTVTHATNATVSGRRLLATNTTSPGVLTIPLSDALNACTWLTEGHETFPLTATTTNDGQSSGVARVAITKQNGCVTWVNTSKVCKKKKGSRSSACDPSMTNPHATGTVTYMGQTYTVTCPSGSQTCTVTPKTSISTSGRKLQQAPGTPACIDYMNCGDFVTTNQCSCPSGSNSCVYNQCVYSGGQRQPGQPAPSGLQYCHTYTTTCNGCFPSDTSVMVLDTSSGVITRKAVIDTAPGDLLQVVEENGSLGWSPAYAFPHYERTGTFDFMLVTTDSGAKLRLTPDHYLYTAGAAATPFAARNAVPADKVEAGQYIWRAAAAGEAVQAERISAVERIRDTGLVAPFTVRGNVVVDGVVASSYVDMIGGERAMHAMMSIGRTLWQISPTFVKWLHARRFTEPLMLGIGSFLQKNQDPSRAANPLIHRMAMLLTTGSA